MCTRIESGPCPLCRSSAPFRLLRTNPRECAPRHGRSGTTIARPPTNRSRALWCLSPNPTKTRTPPPVPRVKYISTTQLHVQACLLHSYTHTDTYINTPHHTTHTDTHQHTQTDTGRTLPTHSRLPQTVGWSLQLVHSSAALLRTTSREYCMFMSTRRLICALMLWVMLHPPTRNIVTFRLQSMPRRSARPPRSSTA